MPTATKFVECRGGYPSAWSLECRVPDNRLTRKTVHPWTRYRSADTEVFRPRDAADLAAFIQSGDAGTAGRQLLAVGALRSFNDSCLIDGGVMLDMTALHRIERFDPVTGLITCQAGTSLGALLREAVPHGWVLPVVPSSQFITVGGAIGHDVHGRNQHCEGSFGCHVTALTLVRSGGTVECSRETNRELFLATLGGLGLTGTIVAATLQLKQVPGAWVACETVAFTGLNSCLALLNDGEKSHEYLAVWLDLVNFRGDCDLLRGTLLRGKALQADRPPPPRFGHTRQIPLPFTLPVSPVNRLTMGPFNRLYWNTLRRSASVELDYFRFSYQLDGIQAYPRLLGPQGMRHYQMVLPTLRIDLLALCLEAIGRSRALSFLAGLKLFGTRQSGGLMSFPLPGIVLTMDFRYEGERTRSLFAELDDIVTAAGGRVYLAKNDTLARELFHRQYPRCQEFAAHMDPATSSALWSRLAPT